MPEVVIVGGGIAAIEGLLRLQRLAAGEAQITLVTPSELFVVRPFAVLEPFSPGSMRRYPLTRLLASGQARHVRDALARVEPDYGLIVTASGQEVRYDALLIACGAGQSNPYAHATLFTDRDAGGTFTSIVADLEAERVRSLAFVIPNWPVWPLPLYELALLTAHRARHIAVTVELTIVTAEPRPLNAFGSAASTAIERLLADAGVVVHAGAIAEVPRPGNVVFGDHELAVDRIVTLPRIVGPAIAGLPAGKDWFVPIDAYCRVPDTEGWIFAAGDVTESPVKHGGLGAQQADTAAAGIAHLLGAWSRPDPLVPIIRGTVFTGDRPLYLSARLDGDVGWKSEVHEQPPWPVDSKIMATELGPRLDALAAEP
jgi:sulfide:quinone oxidoreductase